MSSSMGSTLVGSAVKNERIMGQKLMCYGELAKRRVAIGAVSTLSAQERQNGHAILQGDIGIIGAEPTKALTESGDSGAIWVDFAGMAVCMHHGLMTTFDQGNNNRDQPRVVWRAHAADRRRACFAWRTEHNGCPGCAG